ncbi:alpha/beta hydrolase [Sphaerisporangium sp. NPDC051017]|uniref:alpha/beta hydrolase family protein n=1 Tax=Sphaerisporangium sp. NPDC051017 TaxID=3154636 RepID=UPI00342256DC
MTTGTTTQPSDDQINEMLKQMARQVSYPLRSPVLRTPKDVGLDYEDVTFPSADGVPIEAWYIPRSGSDKLVIANHPLNFNRYGYPSHLEPWRSFGAAGGNTFEVDYMEDYRILHDAGYNVLTYDFRNQGQSGQGNGGVGGQGFMARDVVGSLQFSRSDARTRDLTIGLFSRCQGANASMYAMHRRPEQFEDVRCMVAPQPLSMHATLARALESVGMPERLAQLEREIQLVSGLTREVTTPIPAAGSVRVPTFLYQVRDDLMTTPDDVQAIFDAIPIEDKQLMWIEGSTARWDGYLEFQRNPAPMLEWFAKHMA